MISLEKKAIFFCFLLYLITIKIAFAQSVQYIVKLGDEKANAHLLIDLNGGSFVDFKLSGQTVNPFSWYIPISDMPPNNQSGAVFQGHFLCLGRWGAPTTGEIRAGVPHNGQAGNQLWEVVSYEKNSHLIIQSQAPLDGIKAIREIRTDMDNSIFKVTDYIQSTISIGRPFNIVQHATIGTPFLTKSTIIDSNADRGFMQHLSYPNPHSFEYIWPHAIIDTLGRRVDLTSTELEDSYVSTHLFNDSIGWVTASSIDNELLIGYIWNADEYPWLNLWNEIKEGKPWAKGLEFGTTGIGRSYQDLLAIDTRFHGVNSSFYLDALENITKSFLCFQVRIPKDYKGVKEIIIAGDEILLYEKNSSNHRIITIRNKFGKL